LSAGSNLKLSTGVDYKINGDKAGVTYNYYCVDGDGNQTSTHVECSSNVLRPGEGNKMNPLTLEDECNDGAEERYRKNFYGFVDPYTTSQDDRDPSAGYPNSGLNGFSDPFTHVPFAIFGESVEAPITILFLYLMKMGINYSNLVHVVCMNQMIVSMIKVIILLV